MTAPRAASLTCPDCHTALVADESSLACTGCGARHPIRDGVASFCETEAFYEDYLEEHCPFLRNPPAWKANLLRVLPYWSWREWKFFELHVPRGGRILDLGCARGKEWFSARAGFVAGVDPIVAPLRECVKHYDVVAQAEITRLPFASASFDCVVTSHVLGHIAPEDKDKALAEIARVLRPGGVSVNIAETDSEHSFVRLGKSDPELYRINFIETDGHIGLELPSALLARFRCHGFVIEEAKKMESGLIHLRYYEKYLGKGYPARNRMVRRRIALWNRISSNPVLLGGYEVAMGAYHKFAEPLLTPFDNAMFVAVCAVKR